jgi:hypothetical protein
VLARCSGAQPAPNQRPRLAYRAIKHNINVRFSLQSRPSYEGILVPCAGHARSFRASLTHDLERRNRVRVHDALDALKPAGSFLSKAANPDSVRRHCVAIRCVLGRFRPPGRVMRLVRTRRRLRPHATIRQCILPTPLGFYFWPVLRSVTVGEATVEASPGALQTPLRLQGAGRPRAFAPAPSIREFGAPGRGSRRKRRYRRGA